MKCLARMALAWMPTGRASTYLYAAEYLRVYMFAWLSVRVLVQVHVRQQASDSDSPPGSSSPTPLQIISNNPLYQHATDTATTTTHTRHKQQTPAQTALQTKADISSAAVAHAGAESEDASSGKWGATWPQQIRILLSRCLRVRRFQSLSIQRIVEVLVVAVLGGLFWFQVRDSV